MSSLINMITGKGNNNNADSNSSASSSSSSSTSSGSMSSSRSSAADTSGYNPNTHTQGYSNSGYGTSGAGTGTATGVAGTSRRDQYGSNAAADTTTAGSNVSNDGYMTRSEEQLRVGKEAFESGRAQLGKHVTTENVSTSVPISKERVVVEREPISSADIDSGNLRSDIGEQSYEMRMKEERAIAEKEVVPIEKVRMRKEVETNQQEVGADLRKEHLDYNDGTGYNTNTGTYQKSNTTADGGMPTTSNTGYGTTSTGTDYGTNTGTGYGTAGNTNTSSY